MHREKKDKHFIHKPTYPGGREALSKFVNENLKYPVEAMKEGVEGTVTLKYTIDYKGNVVETQVISGLGHGCDEEAERVVKLLKFDVPKQRRVKVQFHKNIHVHFKLPKKQSEVATSITYSYRPKPKEQSTGTGKGYGYTINIPDNS